MKKYRGIFAWLLPTQFQRQNQIIYRFKSKHVIGLVWFDNFVSNFGFERKENKYVLVMHNKLIHKKALTKGTR